MTKPIIKSDLYDVIIVGSGAGGGMSSYVLANSGLKVLMLEAGRNYDPTIETPMFNTPSQAPLRGTATPDKPIGFYDATVDGGWEVPNEPYAVAEGSEFMWWRARMLGGRTNHWGRRSFRFGPYDFKPYSRDGLGFDWPLTYDDLAPWYDKVEQLIGVTGAAEAEGFENAPDSPSGILLPAPPLRPSELFLSRGLKRMGFPVGTMHAAVLTQPLNGRSACFYATDCQRGCSIRANFQSTTVLIPSAKETGNLDIRTNALVYQVDLDTRGLAKGVSFVDRASGQHHSVRARIVVLAAGACESARVLLNSKSSSFPNGLANESGQVGRNLTDSASTIIRAQFPALEQLPPRNDDGISIEHLYVPWWGHQQQARKELNFSRGYHIQLVGGGRRMPDMWISDISQVSHGLDLRRDMRNKYGSFFDFVSCGEMIPNDKSFCDIDPTLKDKWGIPSLRFHFQWGDPEIKQVSHQIQTVLGIVERLGGKVVDGTETDSRKAILPGGATMHEVGTTRMGSSAKNSVVNQFGQSWSVKNLFVMDGGVFSSHPEKNPTLSILALAWRSSAYLVEKAKKGNI